jgi:uncharacterized protein YbjQ (UPF0145 family)
MIVVTTNDIVGHRVIRYLGLVRGITVRSRSIVGNIGAGIQAIFGGNISLYTSLCEKAREEAYELMVAHAEKMGATRSSPCVMTPTKLPRALPRFWPMERR